MSNATQHSRNSGDSRRRRSRGGRNQSNNQQDNRRSDDRGSRDSRGSRDNRSSNRSEDYRPQSPRPARTYAPVKLSLWQKLLRLIGLYKEPARNDRKSETPRPQTDPRPTKSNIRNARTSEGSPDEDSGDRSDRGASKRGPRDRATERPRGGDGSTVESPRVYVGNLSYDVSEQDLQELFKGIGGVRNVEIVYNRTTHRSKGYGFVEMLHMDEAVRAVEVLHDQPFMGRKLTVSGAKSKGQDERDENEERPERAPRRVVVAPLPDPVVAAAPVQDDDLPEPVIQTIVENVTAAPAVEAPQEETPAVAEAAPVESEAAGQTEPKSEVA